MRWHRVVGLSLIVLGLACLAGVTVAMFTPWGDSNIAIRLGIPGAMLAPLIGLACLLFGASYWITPDVHKHVGRAVLAVGRRIREGKRSRPA
jgi:hypothetical protein